MRGVTSSASVSATKTSLSATAKVTDCHLHGATQFCVDAKGNEGFMSPAPTNPASSYSACHSHETATFCLDDAGKEFQFVVEDAESEETGSGSESGMNCHFHAGVEHCVAHGSKEAPTCERVERDYNLPVRIGTLFAVLATSMIGVFLPMAVKKFTNASLEGTVITFFKQFGTGVILSTALVHLLTHALLMFANECLTLHYESTSTAIAMAGLFLAFLVDFATTRIILARKKTLAPTKEDEDSEVDEADAKGELDKISVILLEVGIIFHSVLVGLVTVVAGDAYYITLLIVILFHQAFEGVALGSRIAELRLSVWVKILMGMGFAITTPIGMGIGIGVLKYFNGNDPNTILAIGTLDAVSAGILLWVGLIEMLAHDWLHGPLAHAGILKIAISLTGLVAGMILMSFLGKWT